MILNSLQKCVALTAYVSAVLIAVTVGSATLTARADGQIAFWALSTSR